MYSRTSLLQRRSELSSAKQALLEKRRRRESIGALPASTAIVHEPERGHTPLSFAQQRFWFLQQLEPESSVYNEPIAFKLAGRLDITALERAAREIMCRHEVLRSTYAMTGGQVIQEIGRAHV